MCAHSKYQQINFIATVAKPFKQWLKGFFFYRQLLSFY
ncbi:hypothetical protein RU99_GL001753 [Enterococcus casseliflavus]|nr:hypothetical protein RU99_GL001753 [Enterococcus casseliflavus]